MRLNWKGSGLIFGVMPSASELERIGQQSREVKQWYSDLLLHHNALRAYSEEDGRYPEIVDDVVWFWMRWHALEHGDPRANEHVMSWHAVERKLRIGFIDFLTRRLGIRVLIDANRLVLMASLPLFRFTPEGFTRAEEAYRQFQSYSWWWPYETAKLDDFHYIAPPKWKNGKN